jgi:ABC-type amino acid transport substrate-binding protein
MTELTLEPGVLRVASAFPDPPFEVSVDGKKTGFDTELMRLICDDLGIILRPVRYAGDDFNVSSTVSAMEATTPSYRAPRSRPGANGWPSSLTLTSSSIKVWP